MNTESTSAPAPVRATVVPPRGRPARRAAPSPRPPASGPPFSSCLIAVDCVAVLLGASVLTGGQRDAALLVQLTLCVAVLDARAGLYRWSGATARVPAGSALVRVLDELPALAGRAAVAWCATAALLAAQSPQRAVGLATLTTAYAAHLAFASGCRAVVHHRWHRAARDHPRSALVVGPEREARRLADTLARHPEYGIRPVGIVGVRAKSAVRDGERPALPVLTTAEEIRRVVVQNSVCDAVFLAGAERPGLVALLRDHGCASWLVGAAGAGEAGGARSGGDAGTAPMSRHLWGHAYRRLDAPAAPRGPLSKRLLDVVVAGCMLVALSPLLLLCAAAVRLADGPGVLFRQQRVGREGRLFTLLKFRTLRPADEREAATRWNVAHDHRMSAVGAFLRRTSLDELPQLWNVLRGDMSLVGPRPERPYFVERFSDAHPGYAARHRMPVGLTGLAQVHGLRGDTSIEDRCRFDNHYIDHWSLWQDVCILLRTALSLTRPAGS